MGGWKEMNGADVQRSAPIPKPTLPPSYGELLEAATKLLECEHNYGTDYLAKSRRLRSAIAAVREGK